MMAVLIKEKLESTGFHRNELSRLGMVMREVGIEGRFEEVEEDKDDDDSSEYFTMSVMMSVRARLKRASLRTHDGVYSGVSHHRNELSRLGMREVDIEGRFEEEEEDDHDECARKTRKSFVVH
jgi:hypothetical protein